MAYVKGSNVLGQATIATFGILPEFGWDPVIYGPAHISIVLNLAYQIKYADAPILMDNKELRFHADRLKGMLDSRSSIVDELPKQIRVGWHDYRANNLLAAHVIAEFMDSFIRETEWDMSNYRTWLAASKPKFVVPWMIPLAPKGTSDIKGVQQAIEEGNDGLLFDLEQEGEMERGKTDSACVLVKTSSSLGAEDRAFFKKVLEEKYGIQDKRVIFIKIPTMPDEPAGALVLLNIRGICKKLLPIVTEAEDAWDSYKDEYQSRNLAHEEFKKAVIDVSSHLG